ncbi:MAG: stage II sporulation protein R [Sarcina sp.]
MKKILLWLVGIVVLVGMFSMVKVNSVQAQMSVEDISDKLIRFHVLANSDSKEDQDLKIKVRDEVIAYINPYLENSKSIDESRSILKSKEQEVIEIAKKVIKSQGYDYDVSIELKKTNFPVKTYGNVTLPQGEYEAFRVLIGEAKGQNWWCVMFPPLCFIDMSKGQISYEESEKQLKEFLDEGEYKMITQETEADKEIKIEFKFLDFFKGNK